MTVESALSTVYAACANSRNYASTINGQGIDTAFSNNNQNYNTANTAASTKEDCCSSCFANPLCVSTAFEPDFQAGQQCFVIFSSQPTCAARDYLLTAIYNNPALPPGGGYSLSNGACGQYNAAQNGA